MDMGAGIKICEQCWIPMQPKGEISTGATLYQCPKCKNVELHLECDDPDLRMTYP